MARGTIPSSHAIRRAPAADAVRMLVQVGTVGRRRASGGDDRIRTGDPRLAKAVLYQLSYVPKWMQELWQTACLGSSLRRNSIVPTGTVEAESTPRIILSSRRYARPLPGEGTM